MLGKSQSCVGCAGVVLEWRKVPAAGWGIMMPAVSGLGGRLRSGEGCLEKDLRIQTTCQKSFLVSHTDMYKDTRQYFITWYFHSRGLGKPFFCGLLILWVTICVQGIWSKDKKLKTVISNYKCAFGIFFPKVTVWFIKTHTGNGDVQEGTVYKEFLKCTSVHGFAFLKSLQASTFWTILCGDIAVCKHHRYV